LQQLLNKALQTTSTDWKTLACIYRWVHQLAQVLDDTKDYSVEERQLSFQIILLHMQKYAPELSASWQKALAHFLKVTQSYAPHLFFCYQLFGLPRTNNDLERSFGRVRHHERRATGRRGALPGLVVRGAVRLQATLATRAQIFTAQDLTPHNLHTWREVRTQISFRQDGRRKQSSFRKDPDAYLAALETQFLKEGLRS
jgi:hypothetical protein